MPLFGVQSLLSVWCIMAVILSHPYFLLTIFSEAEVVVGSAGAAGQLCATVGMPLRGRAMVTAMWLCQQQRERLLPTPGLSVVYEMLQVDKGSCCCLFSVVTKILEFILHTPTTHTQRLFSKEVLEEPAAGLSGVPYRQTERRVGVFSASEGACSPFWILLNLPVLWRILSLETIKTLQKRVLSSLLSNTVDFTKDEEFSKDLISFYIQITPELNCALC